MAKTTTGFCLVLAGLLFLTTGCRQDMHDQAKYEPLEPSTFYANGMASRSLVANTVPRGFLRDDTVLFTGLDGSGTAAATFPVEGLRGRIPGAEDWSDKELWGELLTRGEKRYGMFCTPCHDSSGGGNGMIVQRGFQQPPSFHEERLRESPAGYFVNVVTQGFGQMSGYASQITPEDRWAIAAYVRALQLSQNVRLAELPASVAQSFESAMAEAGNAAAGHGDSGHGSSAAGTTDHDSGHGDSSQGEPSTGSDHAGET